MNFFVYCFYVLAFFSLPRLVPKGNRLHEDSNDHNHNNNNNSNNNDNNINITYCRESWPRLKVIDKKIL